MRSSVFALAWSVAALVPATLFAQGSPTSDLRVTAQATPATVAAGEPLAFRFLIENLGPDAATNVSANFTSGGATSLDVGFSGLPTFGLSPHWVQVASERTCALSPPPPIFPIPPATYHCFRPTLAAGASEVIELRGTVRPGVEGPIHSRLIVVSDSADPNEDNNDSGRIEAVLGSPAQSIPSDSPLALGMLALLLATVVGLRLRRS